MMFTPPTNPRPGENINSLSLSPNCVGEKANHALSHCDFPLFIFLVKKGGTLYKNRGRRPRTSI